MNCRRTTRPLLAAALALALSSCDWPPATERMIVTAATVDPSAPPAVPSDELAAPESAGSLVDPGSPGVEGPEQNPIPDGPELAPTGFLRPGGTVDGIRCSKHEKFLFHVHTRLTVFVSGKPRQIPAAIGIAPPLGIDHKPNGQFFVNNGDCFAWLHTHTPDGIIHIESPIQRRFTLGNFFDVWGQPLGPNRVGPQRGHVTAFFNGKRYLGDPRNIPLGRHVEIQLDVGDPLVAPEHIPFGGGL
jgi:hypothetical protein